MFTVNQITNGKWTGQWIEATEEACRELIATLKISRRRNSYNIESPNGAVIDVFYAENHPKYTAN